jgi:CspA family cold shock protein
MAAQDQLEVTICQRCGRGFVLTATYQDFLARWGKEVISPVLCHTCFLRKRTWPKKRGAVKWFSSRKHYGFITTEENRDVFFHQQQLLKATGNSPQKGQTAHFHVRYSAKGPEALNVEIKE